MALVQSLLDYGVQFWCSQFRKDVENLEVTRRKGKRAMKGLESTLVSWKSQGTQLGLTKRGDGVTCWKSVRASTGNRN